MDSMTEKDALAQLAKIQEWIICSGDWPMRDRMQREFQKIADKIDQWNHGG